MLDGETPRNKRHNRYYEKMITHYDIIRVISGLFKYVFANFRMEINL